MIKNLVLEGGGVKGIAYAGAYKSLMDLNLLSNLEKVAGVSVGSIAALLISLNYSPDDMKNIVWNLDFNKFEDGWLPFRIFSKYGLYKGDYALAWIESLVYKATSKSKSTFIDLKGKFKELHVIACDLNTRALVDFNWNDTPDVIISEAIRCSMSIPIFFDSFRLSQGYNNHLFTDGGLVWNFPLEIFDMDADNEETLGLALWDYNGFGTNNPLDYNNIMSYIGALIDTISTSQSDRLKYLQADNNRVIRIDDFGISPTDFSITNDNKQSLFNAGIEYVTKHFS